MTTVTGIDVSHYQGKVRWPEVARAGHGFGFCKGTEGAASPGRRGFVDGQLAANRAGLAAVGLFGGIYHFARPSSYSAAAEADHYLATVGKLTARELPILDLEDDKVPAGQDLTGWALEWLDRVETAAGRTPIMYSFRPYFLEHCRADRRFARFPFWLASYTSTTKPLAPWGGWTFWQHTSSGRCPGIDDDTIDLNLFAGDRAALERLYGAGGGAAPLHRPDFKEQSIAMARTAPQIVAGHKTKWPNGRWTTITATPEGAVHVANDVSALDGSSDFYFGDLVSRKRKPNHPIDGLVQLVNAKGVMTGYVLISSGDDGTFEFGAGEPVTP